VKWNVFNFDSAVNLPSSPLEETPTGTASLGSSRQNSQAGTREGTISKGKWLRPTMALHHGGEETDCVNDMDNCIGSLGS
jgi:hypothetical protein